MIHHILKEKKHLMQIDYTRVLKAWCSCRKLNLGVPYYAAGWKNITEEQRDFWDRGQALDNVMHHFIRGYWTHLNRDLPGTG